PGIVVPVDVSYESLRLFGFFQYVKQLVGNAVALAASGESLPRFDAIEDLLFGLLLFLLGFFFLLFFVERKDYGCVNREALVELPGGLVRLHVLGKNGRYDKE